MATPWIVARFITGFVIGVSLTVWLTGSDLEVTWCEAMRNIDTALYNAL